jgi:hypothetical protein
MFVTTKLHEKKKVYHDMEVDGDWPPGNNPLCLANDFSFNI